MPISAWSTTPASNNSSPPNGWPEGMLPSQVNDTARQQMADHKTQWLDAEWFNRGDSGLSRASSVSFKLTSDLTAVYQANRRIKCFATATVYGSIASSSYSAPDTTVTITRDAGSSSLTSSLSSVYLGILSVTNKSIPPVPGALVAVTAFTGSGTWTKNAKTNAIEVWVVGGGGGGGSGTVAAGAGGIGGAGGGTCYYYATSGFGSSQTITVGAGGSAGSGGAGGTGGTSSFGAICSATGGAGGAQGTSANSIVGSAGGVGSGGTINFGGGSSDTIFDVTVSSGGGTGGNSIFGGGAAGGIAGNNAGNTGRNYGGGGGGGGGQGGGGGAGGGAGAPGILWIKEYA